MRLIFAVLAVLLLLSGSVMGVGLPRAPVLQKDSYRNVTDFSADDGVAVFRVGSTAYGHVLGSTQFVWLRAQVQAFASTSDHIIVSRSDVSGISVYGANALFGWDHLRWNSYGGGGAFGRTLAMTEGMVIASVWFSNQDSRLMVYDLETSGYLRHIQTIQLPGTFPQGGGANGMQVLGRDLLVRGTHDAWLYTHTSNGWEFVTTLPGESGLRPLADIGTDFSGAPLIAYSTDHRNLYLAPLGDAHAEPIHVASFSSPIGNFAISTGVIALTVGTTFPDLRIYVDRGGDWVDAYDPTHTSIGRLHAYLHADVSNGHVIVKGADYGVFEPNRWVRFYAIPEGIAGSVAQGP